MAGTVAGRGRRDGWKQHRSAEPWADEGANAKVFCSMALGETDAYTYTRGIESGGGGRGEEQWGYCPRLGRVGQQAVVVAPCSDGWPKGSRPRTASATG